MYEIIIIFVLDDILIMSLKVVFFLARYALKQKYFKYSPMNGEVNPTCYKALFSCHPREGALKYFS